MATWSGLTNDLAVRAKVASSNFHFGEASCQISRLNASVFAA